MRTQVLASIKIERIPGTSYVRLLEDFLFFSETLNPSPDSETWSCIPAGFVYDEESEWILKGSNPEAGAIHDYYSRSDSGPVVDKATAAAIYQEFQEYFDCIKQSRCVGLKRFLLRSWHWIKRQFKTGVVEIAPDYFHKHEVMASYEEIAA